MSIQLAGNTWLKHHFKLNRHVLTHSSYIGHNSSIELTSKGNMERVYSTKYAPGEKAIDHLAFSLKYDDLNLDFLKEVIERISEAEIVTYINNAPSGKYARKIGFLYEFISRKELFIKKEITGNYVDLIDSDKYFTSTGARNQRWRINDNLLGTSDYCPMVRRTNELNDLLKENIPEKIETLKTEFPPEVFRRATDYLYKKETKSSYEIEREEPTPDRIEKFIVLLLRAGSMSNSGMLKEKRLVELQNAIVDPRFAVNGFRNFQNYIGQSLPNFRDLVHYICPPPNLVASLMKGICETALKTTGVPAEVRAAIIAFGFVFIHPFEDGNGRIHRFLIHDVLASDSIVPNGMIIPVSAHMVNHRKDYDDILETYSKPLMQFARYDLNAKGELVLTNPQETESYFRYPDLTDHCIYLASTIHTTLNKDMPEELMFLQRYDEAKTEIQNIVDMPDKLLNQMILILHQNKGVLPKRRRAHFDILTDKEIIKIEASFKNVFELN